MAKNQDTTAETSQSKLEIYELLRSANIDPRLFSKISEQIETANAKAVASAARLFYRPDDDERGPLTPVEFSDELDNVARRMWGLSAAIDGAFGDSNDSESAGVRQLSADVARDMKRLAEAFEAEYWLAREQEAQQ
jgi:hypothetical protein